MLHLISLMIITKYSAYTIQSTDNKKNHYLQTIDPICAPILLRIQIFEYGIDPC